MYTPAFFRLSPEQPLGPGWCSAGLSARYQWSSQTCPASYFAAFSHPSCRRRGTCSPTWTHFSSMSWLPSSMFWWVSHKNIWKILKNKKHFVSSVAVCSSQQCSRPSPSLWRWPCSSSCFGFRGCYKVFSPLFSGFFYLFSRCSRCSQPHPDLPHPQGKKAGNEFIKDAFFSRRSSTSSTMRNGSS